MKDLFPYKSFGALISSLRLRAGLSQQSDLAQRMQTTQQTVSRWEAGSSRPRDKQMPLLATVLQTDVAELLAAAGYTSRIPVATFDQPFPIDSLSPESFERFCLYFLSSMYPNAEVHRVGGVGHTQDGVDVDVTFQDNTSYSFQCKRVQNFGPAQVHAAISKHTRNASKKFIVLTRPAASPGARLAAKQHPDWDVWDREDISRIIRQHLSKDQQVRLVDTFFHGQRLPLLGETEAGPWQTTKEFFAAFGPGRKAFSHQWHLVGRTDDLRAIDEALVNHRVRATIVVGSGGAGKSRVLKQAIETYEHGHPGVLVRFLSPTESLTNESLGNLGNLAKLLVVDDAHDHEDLRPLFEYAANNANNATLLLTLRPYGLEQIRTQVCQFLLLEEQVVERKLEPLTLDQAAQLAAEVLKMFDGPTEAAKDIARLTADCPLFTVVGAQIVAQERIPLEFAKNENQFRFTLLGRFNDIITGHVGGKGDAVYVKKLLNILALVQPFHLDDQSIVLAVEQLEGIRAPDTSRIMRLLIEAGVLFKRGGRYRLSPDLLADYIIETSCISDGRSTGYAERLFDAVKPAHLQNLLLNLGKLDWRLANGDPSNSRLLDGVWSRLRPTSKYGDPHVSAVKSVAFYQPQRALGFAEKLIREGEYFEDLPYVIRNAAYNLAYLRQACECLWQLGKMDDRKLNANPGHAIRLLSELAAIEPQKPLAFSDVIIDFALFLASHSESWAGAYTPLDLVSGFMSTEGHTTTSNGRAVSFGPFFVNPDAVRDMRLKVVDAVISLLKSADIRIAFLAAKFIPNCIRYPMGMFGAKIDELTRESWTREFVSTLRKIEDVTDAGNIDPLVQIQIMHGVSWHATYARNETSPIAARIIKHHPNSLEFRVLTALEGEHGHLAIQPDLEQLRKERAKFTNTLVADLQSTFDSGEKLHSYLSVMLSKIGATNPEAIDSACPFLDSLIRASYSLARYIAADALKTAGSATAQYAGIALSVVISKDRGDGFNLAEEFLKRGTRNLSAAVAHALRLRSFEGGLDSEEEINMLRSVLASDDEWVIRSAIDAVSALAARDRRLAIALLKLVHIGGSNRVADLVLVLFQKNDPIPFQSLTEDDVHHFLNGLMELQELDGYWIETFLSSASEHYAQKAAKFFMARAEHAARHEDWHFRVCNYGPYCNVALRFRESGDFHAIMKEFRHWAILHSERAPNFAHRVGQLFDAMFRPYDPEIVTFLIDWTNSGSAVDIRIIAQILREAEPDFVFKYREFVCDFVEKAGRYGKKSADLAVSSLVGSAISGVKSSIPGEPAPADIRMRDAAEEAMQNLSRFSPARAIYEALHKHASDCIQLAVKDREAFDDD